MESPPAAIDHPPTPGGVATLPTASHLRSLISASQGARPLSNVFAYRTTRMTRTAPMRRPASHSAAPFVSSGVFATRASFSRISMATEDSPAEPRDDERKPPPREEDEPTESPSSTDEEMPALMSRSAFESNSDISSHYDRTMASTSLFASSALTGAGATYQPAPPETRAARKRRSEESGPPAKRPAVASMDGKPAANLKIDQDDCSDAGSCCICMCDPDEGELSTIDSCDHNFCFECIEKWSERENTCPLCKIRFNRITRVDKTKKKKGQKGTKKVKQRDQRADLNPGNALEGLLGEFLLCLFTTKRICHTLTFLYERAAGLNANSGFSSSIARLIFSGLGPAAGGGVIDFGIGASNIPAGMARRTPRQVRYRNPPTQIEDALFSDNDDGSDDDQTGYADFVTNMRRMNQQRGAAVFGAYPMMPTAPALGRRTPGRSATFAAAIAASAPLMTRSYATNAHVANVGGTADNALEIEDDSDEDEVEVIDVRGGA